MLRVSAPRHPHVIPVLAVGLERVRIVSVAAGHAHTCCIDSDGGLHTMGYNDRGQVSVYCYFYCLLYIHYISSQANEII